MAEQGSEMETAEFTYSRGVTGRKKLVDDLKSDIGRAKKEFTGSKLTDIKTVISNYWQGADANKFYSELTAKAKEAAKACDKYVNTIETALTSDASAFDKMQESNASSIANLK